MKSAWSILVATAAAIGSSWFVPGLAWAQQTSSSRPSNEAMFRTGEDQQQALEYAGCIYKAVGYGHTFMVKTSEGNVIIDTSLEPMAPRHRKLLREVSTAPVKYVIVTHAHPDHTGGIRLWKEEGTEVIAHRLYEDFREYAYRLAGFYNRRNAAQFATDTGSAGARSVEEGIDVIDFRKFGAPSAVTRFFNETYTFKLGELTFELFHTPGETPDMLSVWIPELKAVFTSDNFGNSFPNIYTLRGTRPRWALDYVESIDKYLALKPELLLPSHTDVRVGNDLITAQLRERREAILYVHDATVRGMNEGKDVYTLMREIKLPEHLRKPERYGKVSWSVRGIYEGYVGWFDGNPASMYATPPSAVFPILVPMAGGARAVAERAMALVEAGDPVRALRLADAALAAEPNNQTALKARLAGLTALEQQSSNSNERGWLKHGIRMTRESLEGNN